MKIRLLLIALILLILTSTIAIAGNNEECVSPVADINFTDRVVYIMDHTSDPEEGNWITMDCPSEGRQIQLPQPINFTYYGPKYIKYGGASGTLYRCEDENYTITYPSTPTYYTHPVYLSGEEVNMSFHGDCSLEGDVEIYLFNITSKSFYGVFDAFKAGNIENLNDLFQNSMDGNYKKYSTVLGKNGDLLDYNLGPLDAGQYCIVIVQKNEDDNLTALSATAFIVAEHELRISAPSCMIKGENLDICVSLENATNGSNCTYAAVLIRDQAYKANIKIYSNGTRNSTSVLVNEIDLIKEFNINSSNYRSKLTRNELQTEIQTIIGENKGSIAIGDKGQNRLSLTAFDLPPGSYCLLAGAYVPGEGLVGLAQEDVEIKSKDSSGNGGGNGNGGNGGKVKSQAESGSVLETAHNIESKEISYCSVSNGNQMNFELTQDITPIKYVRFNSNKTSEDSVVIVENLNGESSITFSKPEGEIYKYVNIRMENGDLENFKDSGNAIVGFEVSKNWITDNDININSTALQHFSRNKWVSLPTAKLNENQEYIYFEAETPSFSPFAITAEKNLMAIEKKTGETQIPLGGKAQDKSGLITGSDVLSQENMNSGISKIASFSVGFLIVILMGTVIKKKLES